MKFKSPNSRLILPIAATSFALFVAASFGQDLKSQDHSKHVGMAEQIEELQAEVARLKTATAADHQAKSGMPEAGQNTHPDSGKGHTPPVDGMSKSSSGMAQMEGMGMEKMGMEKGMQMMEMGMGMMKGMDMGKKDMAMGKSDMSKGMQMMEMGMGMMKKMGMGDMEDMSSDAGGGMQMDGKGMEKVKGGMDMGIMDGMKMMDGMGKKMMGQMPDASMGNSALPGFAGASHIYHIGSTGFFLDHTDHLGLTPEQQEKLNQIKESSVLEQNEFDRKIEGAEEEVWALTGTGVPDGAAIEKQLTDIGALSARKRLNFIQAVGKAAEVLTEDQRTKLVGGETGDEKKALGDDHKDHKDHKD